jgi:adenylate cyclase
MALRFSSFNYLILYVMGAALTTSPVLVIWTGLAAAATWSACVFIVISLHGTITVGSLRLVDARLTTTEQLRIYLDPLFVSIVAYQAQLLVLLLGSSVLAFGVWRSRRSLFERIQIAAERRNLARFLPADLADDLASGPALEAVSRKPVAVLFVDIVGYTAISERMVPEAALTLLSAFRARVAAVVVEHGGTIDKFIGDGVMVTFGTRNDGADIYAEQSLRCTLEIVDDMERWNKGREAANEAPLRVGMGLQCGEMLVGTIGAIERLEHTVLGDAVNVASRLERLTREYGTLALVGEAVFERALRDCGNLDLLERFGPCIRLEIRGRLEAIEGRAMLANQ